MLTIDAARDLVLGAVTPLPAQDVAIADALDRILATGVDATHAVPRFDNSAMDGFALRAGPAGRRLRIVGESRAGAPSPRGVEADDEAVRISTGAVLPAGADTVVMVERTEEAGDETVLVQTATEPEQNVRRAGTDMLAGTRVLLAGTVLGPAELGVAANAGLAALRCGRRPRVAILATGDELVAPGGTLGPGQIHESNALTLSALARRAGAEVVAHAVVADTPEATAAGVSAALRDVDVLVCSGGVSVGPHDHVKGALAAAGARERFWRVALRPGKPTWFGTTPDGRLAFGLPGNPVSAMVTFLLFVRPALLALQGADGVVPRRRARLATALARNPGRDECVRVRLRDGVATPTGPQGSHVLTSMLGADAFALVPAGEGAVDAGAEVEVELIA